MRLLEAINYIVELDFYYVNCTIDYKVWSDEQVDYIDMSRKYPEDYYNRFFSHLEISVSLGERCHFYSLCDSIPAREIALISDPEHIHYYIKELIRTVGQEYALAKSSK